MIKEIRYKNFKALRDATLPLGRFTLIVGANGTGKSTAIKAIKNLENINASFFSKNVNLETDEIEIKVVLENIFIKKVIKTAHNPTYYLFNGSFLETLSSSSFASELYNQGFSDEAQSIFNFQLFSFESAKIAQHVSVIDEKYLESDGGNLAGILDLLKDTEPERWEDLNTELADWFPEFDKILFDRSKGQKSVALRTKIGKYLIKSNDLSEGTLLALAYLTVAYLPNPPKVVAFEEPERGIHPRLLQNIQEAMYRLAYPENYGEKREPIQVIATTHSPYLLDLYKDNPEEIVIAEKDENGVHFKNLAKMENIEKILHGGESLGEVWFTGVLGGVPAHI
jgi:predicted ATPase